MPERIGGKDEQESAEEAKAKTQPDVHLLQKGTIEGLKQFLEEGTLEDLPFTEERANFLNARFEKRDKSKDGN